MARNNYWPRPAFGPDNMSRRQEDDFRRELTSALIAAYLRGATDARRDPPVDAGRGAMGGAATRRAFLEHLNPAPGAERVMEYLLGDA